MDNIFTIVKRAEKNLLHGKPIKIGKYAEHDHVEKISTIDAYLNSQHISGKTDSLDREKPFFNISLMAAYVWYKTTDIDRKHIRFTPGNSKQRLKALIATIKLRLWMNKKNFGAWLNQWGWTLSVYGSAVSKFVEKDGKLIPSVIAWDRMICDPIDFNNNVQVEKLYFTPAQLRQQGYNEDAVEEAIEKFQMARTDISGHQVDIKNEYVGIYEVHGNLPLSVLKRTKGEEYTEEDETTYIQQMHVLFMDHNKRDKKNYEVCLYSGKEEKSPYYLSHLIEQDGRTLSIGAFETLFDAQWMTNHSVKQVKDQLDLASKQVTQTADPNFLGRNVLTEVETGSILIHEEGRPLTQVNLQSHDIPQILGYLDQWKSLGKEASGSVDSLTGATLPSGTPYRLGMMLNQEARGLFDMMRQNKGLHLEEILRTYIIPHFKKTLKNTKEIIAILDGEELEEFDELSLPARLHQELLAGLSVGIPSTEDLMMAVDEQKKGNLRMLIPSDNKNMTWKEYFKDLDMSALEVEITGENRDKQSILITLDTLLQRMMSAPEMFSPEDVRKVFNKILDETGAMSPLQLNALPSQGTGGQPPQQQQSPMDMAVGGAGMVGAF